MRLMTRDIVAPAGGVMTDEVGVVTGDLTLATVVEPGGVISLHVQYRDADEWYHVTDGTLKVDDPADEHKIREAERVLLHRFG